MPLTSKQRTALEAKAKERGVDPAKLIAEAESMLGDNRPAAATAAADKGGGNGDPKAATKPNLYMYHLPFVTVNEVRTLWLDLDPVAGGDEYAGVWAAKQGGGAKPDPGQQ